MEEDPCQGKSCRLREEVRERYDFSGLMRKSKKNAGCLFSPSKRWPVVSPMSLIFARVAPARSFAARQDLTTHTARTRRPLSQWTAMRYVQRLVESELLGHQKGAFTGAW